MAQASSRTQERRARRVAAGRTTRLLSLRPQEIRRAKGIASRDSRPKDKIYERLWRLFGQLGSDNQTIRTTAREKLDAFLVKQKLSWNGPNGFTAILLSYW